MDDHDLLIRLDEKMDTVLATMQHTHETCEEHDKRLDEEEKWTVRMKTGIGVIGFIITIFGIKIFM